MSPARRAAPASSRRDEYPAVATRPRGVPVEPGVETRMKLERLREWMARHKLPAVVFHTRANVAWLTAGGDAHVVAQSEYAAAALVVDRDHVHVVADVIEIDRLQHEEPLRGFRRRAFPWTRPLREELERLLGARREAWASDAPHRTGGAALPPDFVDACRAELLPSEVDRYEALGHDCTQAVETVARTAEPGDTERDLAARLAAECLVRGVQPQVVLVGADQRIRNFRHPIPTDRTLRRHLMLIACGERHGLVASLTRTVYLGAVPKELAALHAATCRVEAALWGATRPGVAWGDALAAGQRQYAKEGDRDEWTLHHQGGPTGYAARDLVVVPGERRVVHAQQAVAWNPSITGAKSEDTWIVPAVAAARANAAPSPLVVTAATREWPRLVVRLPGAAPLERPDILRRE